MSARKLGPESQYSESLILVWRSKSLVFRVLSLGPEIQYYWPLVLVWKSKCPVLWVLEFCLKGQMFSILSLRFPSKWTKFSLPDVFRLLRSVCKVSRNPTEVTPLARLPLKPTLNVRARQLNSAANMSIPWVMVLVYWWAKVSYVACPQMSHHKSRGILDFFWFYIQE